MFINLSNTGFSRKEVTFPLLSKFTKPNRLLIGQTVIVANILPLVCDFINSLISTSEIVSPYNTRKSPPIFIPQSFMR